MLINYIKVIVVGLFSVTSIIIVFFRGFFNTYFNLYNSLLKQGETYIIYRNKSETIISNNNLLISSQDLFRRLFIINNSFFIFIFLINILFFLPLIGVSYVYNYEVSFINSFIIRLFFNDLILYTTIIYKVVIFSIIIANLIVLYNIIVLYSRQTSLYQGISISYEFIIFTTLLYYRPSI